MTNSLGGEGPASHGEVFTTRHLRLIDCPTRPRRTVRICPAVASDCRDSADDACVTKIAKANVRQVLREIRERSPYPRAYLGTGKVWRVGGLYDVASGPVTFMPR